MGNSQSKHYVQERDDLDFGEKIAEQRQSVVYMLGAVATGCMAMGIAWLVIGDLPNFVRHHHNQFIIGRFFAGLLVLGFLLGITAALAFASVRFFCAGMDRFEYFACGMKVWRFGRVRLSVSYDDITKIRLRSGPLLLLYAPKIESVETLLEQKNGARIRHLWSRSAWKRGLYSAVVRAAIKEETMDAAHVALLYHCAENGVDFMERGEPFPYESDVEVLTRGFRFLRGKHAGIEVDFRMIESMTLRRSSLRIKTRGEPRETYFLSLKSPNAVLCALALQDISGVMVIDPTEDKVESEDDIR
ncbi:MAG: hypothetical protein U0640_06205 [Phycisphaerales bacterium]